MHQRQIYVERLDQSFGNGVVIGSRECAEPLGLFSLVDAYVYKRLLTLEGMMIVELSEAIFKSTYWAARFKREAQIKKTNTGKCVVSAVWIRKTGTEILCAN